MIFFERYLNVIYSKYVNMYECMNFIVGNIILKKKIEMKPSSHWIWQWIIKNRKGDVASHVIYYLDGYGWMFSFQMCKTLFK